jgi:dTDP-3-amino-3,4,6-trideoxy-alpha-D-glucose transaminase
VGQVAATSFYPTKNLGAIGDGGAILTDDAAVARRCAEMRHYGQVQRDIHEHLGLNARLDELQAEILLTACLPRLDAWTERRRAIARRYRATIRHPRVQLPDPSLDADPCWHLFPVLVSGGRDGLRRHLEQRGIQTLVHYPALIPEQRALAGVPHQTAEPLLRATRVARSELSLPVHPYLTDDEIDRVATAVNEWRPL